MLQLAVTILVVSAALAAAAIVSFSWSAAAAKILLVCSIAVSAVGVLLAGVGALHGGVASWAFLFACGSCSCSMTAARHLFNRPPRWIHRFVIYAGYGATFAAMGGEGLWLDSRQASGRLAACAFIGTYVVGSGLIFVAKTMTIRHAAKKIPRITDQGPEF